MKGFVEDIEALTEDNTDFRRVVYTGKHLQLVLMALQPGEEIGEEVHEDHDQFFRVEDGEGEVWTSTPRLTRNRSVIRSTSGSSSTIKTFNRARSKRSKPARARLENGRRARYSVRACDPPHRNGSLTTTGSPLSSPERLA